MATVKLPTIATRTIDLADYDGEGLVYIKALTGIENLTILDEITKTARKEGLKIPSDPDKRSAFIVDNFPFELMLKMLERGVYYLNEAGEIAYFTPAEMKSLPMNLLQAMYAEIQELMLPLMQKDGTASNSEPSMGSRGQ